jgi:heterodisulfide reductase subunit C
VKASAKSETHKTASPEFLEEMEAASGEKIRICYQCGKCSAGCPVGFAMDLLPNQVIRMIQLGLKDEALSCSTIWLCASCETCAARCPREIEIVKVMDALRRMARAQDYHIPVREVPVFISAFLSTVKRFGRLYEAGFVGAYNILSGHLTKDMSKAPAMLIKHKIALKPPRVKGMDKVRRLIRKAEEIRKR